MTDAVALGREATQLDKESPMRRFMLLFALALIASSGAGALEVVEVNGAVLNCLFAPALGDGTCPRTVAEDWVATFSLPFSAGDGRLQSRVMTAGDAGTAGAGLVEYAYRVNLTEVRGSTALSCVSRLIVEFSSFSRFDFDQDRALEDAFAITAAGSGTVGPSRVDRVGDSIAFSFSPAICPGESSYFMGLVSTEPPTAVRAEISQTLTEESFDLEARGPAASPDRVGRRRNCLAGGITPVPDVPYYVPLCRCLEDPGHREFHCGFLRPDFFLERRIPWPVRVGEPFTVEWRIQPLTEMSEPLLVEVALPETISLVEGKSSTLSFEPTPVGQSAKAQLLVSAAEAGEFESTAKVVMADGSSQGLDLGFSAVAFNPQPEPPAMRFLNGIWIALGLAVLLLAALWLARRSRRV